MSTAQSELDWQAFRYISGEMAAAEVADFEERLSDDPQACEAVSRAVGLAELTRAATAELVCVADRSEALLESCGAGRTHVSQRVGAQSPWIGRPWIRRPWIRRLAWMSCGAAACLLFLVLVQPPLLVTGKVSSGRGAAVRPQASSSPKGFTEEGSELALAWAQTRVAAPVDEGEPDAVVSGDAGDEIEELELTAPSWMMAAIVGLQATPAESDSGSGEPQPE